MDEARRKRVRAQRSRGRGTSKVDWISDLPDSLLCQVLLNLTTKDVVRTSVLSKRWGHLWKCVPGLDLGGEDIKQYYKYVIFVDRFLDFNSEYHIESFKLSYPGDGNCETQVDLVRRWIRTVVRLGIKHLKFLDYSWGCGTFHLPRSIYTCKSLVSLKLSCVSMPCLKLVSLPYLRIIELISVKFADNLDLETLITSCAALEILLIKTNHSDGGIQVSRVRSQSLLSFTHVEENGSAKEDLVIDAPNLEYLKLKAHQTASVIIKHHGSLVSVDVNFVFNSPFHRRFDPSGLPKRDMIQNLFVAISRVKSMIISCGTLKVIYDYARCQPLPLFHNLSFLRVKFYEYLWELLPTFLESCPNLKSLILESTENLKTKGLSNFSGSQGFLPSLEHIEIKIPLKGKTEKSVVVKKLLTIPRLSPSCEVVIL
ncbi:hypothetical protein CARUB_v10020283mg [Capsella rubella]|uniref:F-box domain-containing protein n=1 Tax=Capsella rubella TaxID=81985 RepID=R0I9Z5_9BRAS|nr:F-box/LRR-repeat protein 13 isoform X2 [Capsella rubella]EOA33373.1 hypothetical protein CARUB_v10020283mg [Capsella rubella]